MICIKTNKYDNIIVLCFAIPVLLFVLFLLLYIEKQCGYLRLRELFVCCLMPCQLPYRFLFLEWSMSKFLSHCEF